MKELRNNDIPEYVAKAAFETKAEHFDKSGIPFYVVQNPEPVKIQNQIVGKDANFVVFKNGSMKIANNKTVDQMKKMEYTKQEIKTPDNPAFTNIVLSENSPKSHLWCYELRKHDIPHSITTLENTRTKNKILKISLLKNNEKKLDELNNSIEKNSRKTNLKQEPAKDNDVFVVTDNEYYASNNHKYVEEFKRAPEEFLDKAVKIISEINDKIRKCELFLGQMKDAQVSKKSKDFSIAKEKLEKECEELKKYEEKTIGEDRTARTYDKVELSHNIIVLETLAKETTMNSKESVDKVLNNINNHKLTNYYIVHLKDMMDNDNLTAEEKVGISATLTSVGYSKEYKNFINNSLTYARSDDNSSPSLSDAKDGSFNQEYYNDNIASSSSEPEQKEIKNHAQSLLDAINDYCNEEYENYDGERVIGYNAE